MSPPIVLLSAFLLFVLGYFVWGLWVIVSRVPAFRAAWRRTDQTARFAFNLGGLLFFTIPVIKNHPAHDAYAVQVIVEMLPAVAGGLFVAGLLALMQQLRQVDSERESAVARDATSGVAPADDSQETAATN